jgi:hypothetical protein
MSDLVVLTLVYGFAVLILVTVLRIGLGANWLEEVIEDSNIKALFEKEEK